MNVELNITLRCNLRCTNCNRLCDKFPGREEDMTPEQITKFVEQIRHSKRPVRRVKVVGGEPLMHPRIGEIVDILGGAVKEGLIQTVKVNTNRTLPIPDFGDQPVRLMGKKTADKVHLPVLWSPRDMGYVVSGPCSMPRRCGVSLDAFGYLPCSGAMMIVRMLNRFDLYRKELPETVWGMDDLCPHCVFAMPTAWCIENSWPLSKTPVEGKTPTPTWRENLPRCASQPPLERW